MYELIKEFRSQTGGQDLPPSAKLLYYELIFEFNESFWKTELAYSERELSILTGLSKTAINNAIAKLKEFGYIKVVQSHGRRTKFKIASDHFPNSERPESDLRVTTKLPSPLLSIPNNGNKEDVKTVRHEDSTTAVEEVARARASSGVINRWRQATFTNPTELDEEGLAALEKEFGTLKVMYAITEANRYKKQDQINLALVETILTNDRKKGAVKNGESTRNGGKSDKDYKWELPPDLDKY